MRWIAKFIAACNIAVVAALAAAWAAGGFAYMGVHGSAAVIFVVGVIVASELLIGLMALLFYSDQSGQDEVAYSVHRLDESDQR